MARPRRLSPSSDTAPPGVSGQDAILARLRWGPATVEELVEIAGLTANGVRAQLLGLERTGWVRRAGVKRGAGAGKPANLFELSPEAEPRLSRAYLPLLLGLVRALQRDTTPGDRKAMYQRVGRELAQAQGGATGTDFEGRLRAALDVMKELGATIEVTRDKKRVSLRGAGCPLGAAVAVDRCVCQATATLLTELVGVPVADHCVQSERPHCRFELTAKG